MIAQSILSPSMRARWISAVFYVAIVTATIGSSLAFQGTRPVNVENPSTLEDVKAGDANREPYQNATGLVAAWRSGHPRVKVADLWLMTAIRPK